MVNAQIAGIFKKIAQILELKGENIFRIRAYQKAAQAIEGLSEDLTTLVKGHRLLSISGIGKDLADKIIEIVNTNNLKFYEQLRKTIPEGLLQIMDIPGVGPKTAKLLYDKLKIDNIAKLKEQAQRGKISGIFGIKDKTVENILRGIELLQKGKERITIAQAESISSYFIQNLKKIPEIENITTAGSLRRQKETVRDIDILVISKNPIKVMDRFTTLSEVKQVLAKGTTKSSLLTADGIRVDLRVLEQRSFGAALLYFTGSKNFNIKLRQIAIKKGLKISEYGVFKKDKYIAGKTEEEIFKLLGLNYIQPEMREDRGEIELASRKKLPNLIELHDIQGDLHVHSNYSDGTTSISEMANACKKIGYKYIAVTDHSQSLRVARGLSLQELKRKKKEIDKLNSKMKNFIILFGAEVDIHSDGTIDYPTKVLAGFDIVVAAIHSGFKQSRQQLTKRIVKACQNKYVNIIAHPTGRLWGVRQPYDLDFNEILKVCKSTNTFLEINAFPDRLDLDDVRSKQAKEYGLKLAISTDAHSSQHLPYMRYGISTARRGWLEKNDILNTQPLEKLLKEIKK